MTRYATATTVPASKTEQEIKALLKAVGILSGEYDGRVVLAFELHARHIRFETRIPDLDDARDDHNNGNYKWRKTTPGHTTRRTRTRRAPAVAILVATDQSALGGGSRSARRGGDLRRHGRRGDTAAAAAMTAEVCTAQLVLPDSSTVSEWLAPQIKRAYASGEMPALLPGGNGAGPRLLPAARE